MGKKKVRKKKKPQQKKQLSKDKQMNSIFVFGLAFLGLIVIAVALIFAYNKYFTHEGSKAKSKGKVWSTEHGHYH